MHGSWSTVYLIPTFAGGVLRRGSGSLGLKKPPEFLAKAGVLDVNGAQCCRDISCCGLCTSDASAAEQALTACSRARPRSTRIPLMFANQCVLESLQS